MKTALFVEVFVAIGALLLSGCATAPPPQPVDFHLPAPQNAEERAYLGLPQGVSSFTLEEIRCEVLVIDCFDMYCHVCQAGAKHVNALYQLAQERGLGNRVKFVGLGAGDTPLEVATYKEKFKVPFPVFSDRRSVVVRQFAPLKLPNIMVLRSKGGRLELLHQSPGQLLDPAELLSHIQTDLGRVESHHWDNSLQAAQPTCDPRSSCRRTEGGSSRTATEAQ